MRSRGVSDDVLKLLMSSYSQATWKQYEGYIKKWFSFCELKNSDPMVGNVILVLEYLSHLFNDCKLGYSSLNSA